MFRPSSASFVLLMWLVLFREFVLAIISIISVDTIGYFFLLQQIIMPTIMATKRTAPPIPAPKTMARVVLVSVDNESLHELCTSTGPILVKL